MATLTIVAGLPGAGKTTLIQRLKTENPSLGVVEADYMKDSIGNSPRMTASRHFDGLVQSLLSGKDCLIGDIEFLRAEKQEELRRAVQETVLDVSIRWIVFDNDWEQCLRNILQRARGDRDRVKRNLANFFSLSESFHVPDGAEVHAPWRGDD